MDPLNGAASVLAVIQIAATIVSTCYKYRTGAKDARKDITLIINELDSLRDVLKNLEAIFEDEAEEPESRLETVSLLMKPDGPLTQCKLELANLEKKLAIPKDRLGQIKKTLLWPLKEGSTKRC